MGKIIDGRALAEKIKDEIVKEIVEANGLKAKKNNPIFISNRPDLAIILIGEREDSKLYVSLKEKEAVKIGIDTHLYKCTADIKEKEILETIDCLNKDETINGILVQLPLPEGFDTDKIIRAIDPAKDVDGFHPENTKALMSGCDSHFIMPPVHGTILEILKSLDYDPEGKTACLVVNSEVFGKSLAKVLECRGAKIKIAKASDKDLSKKTSSADVLVTAVGQPGLIKASMVKKDAIVIDVGITKVDKKVLGDVDFASVIEKASYLTPVPGGVGPLTIAMLFKNTLALYKK